MDPTIKDVARLAGVSTKTVSNVINNNSGRYSGETHARVLDAIQKLNYRPNRAAQYMRSGVIGILAFAIPDIGNPYFSEIAREIIDAAKEQGYTVLIEHTAGLAENERLLLGGARSHAVDGVILDPVEMTEDEIYRANTAIPIVMLGERATGKFYDHVMIDNVAAARLLTEHLLELGHRRIALLPVSDTGRDSLHRMRYQGYLEAHRAAGIQPDPELIVATSYPTLLTHLSGMTGIEQLLARGPLPDAVFCLNDLTAFGVMKILSQRGYRVPEDIAVVGFDDIAQSYFMSPALTTIAPDKKAIGRYSRVAFDGSHSGSAYRTAGDVHARLQTHCPRKYRGANGGQCMKALVLEQPNQLVYQDVPQPVIGPDDVLIQVKATGICGSDIHGMDGSTGRRIPPIIMGHEAAGMIAQVGAEVSGWQVGDRVTFDSTVYCGTCYYCRRGEINLCDNRRVLGVSCAEYRQHGAFAEYVGVPQHILYRLPDTLTFTQAAMVEPVSIAVHAVERTPLALNDTAVVVGAGMIGLLVVQALRAAGCGQIIAVDLDPGRLALA